MNRAFLVASVIALFPGVTFAYIGFKSAAAYRQHLEAQRQAKIGRATEAIRRNPKDAVAYLYRGNIYAERSSPGAPHGGPNYKEALADYDKAIELDPKLAEAYYHRGQVRLSLRERDSEALADLEKASQLNPKLFLAHVFFAVSTKDGAKAVEAAKQACKLSEYKSAQCLQLLASAYAKCGDFDKAIHWQEKTLAMLTDSYYSRLAKERLEKYRQHKPNEDERSLWISISCGARYGEWRP